MWLLLFLKTKKLIQPLTNGRISSFHMAQAIDTGYMMQTPLICNICQISNRIRRLPYLLSRICWQCDNSLYWLQWFLIFDFCTGMVPWPSVFILWSGWPLRVQSINWCWCWGILLILLLIWIATVLDLCLPDRNRSVTISNYVIALLTTAFAVHQLVLMLRPLSLILLLMLVLRLSSLILLLMMLPLLFLLYSTSLMPHVVIIETHWDDAGQLQSTAGTVRF